MHRILRINFFVIGGIVVLLAGCKIDEFAAAPILSREQLPFVLYVEQREIEMSTVAPYDTLSINAEVQTVDGIRLDDAVIRYQSSDSSLRVSSSGMLTARKAINKVTLTITGEANGAAFRETVNVKITNIAQPDSLQKIRIDRAGGDSNFFAPNEQFFETTLASTGLNSQGNPIAGVLSYWSITPNTTIARLPRTERGNLQYRGPGEIMVYTTTTYYGRTLYDSIRFIMQPPKYAIVHFRDRIRRADGQQVFYFSPDTVVITAEGIIQFVNEVPGAILDIQFDNPLSASPGCPFVVFCGGEMPMTGGSGNIAPFKTDSEVFFGNSRSRRFSHPGTYRYWSAISLDTGVIVVR